MAFSGFSRRQKQDDSLIFSSIDEMQDQSTNDEISYETQCAWCLSEQGKPMGNGSHGICARHAEEMVQSYQSSRRRH